MSPAVIGDLSDPRGVDEAVETAVETFGSVDVLVNNAGIMDHLASKEGIVGLTKSLAVLYRSQDIRTNAAGGRTRGAGRRRRLPRLRRRAQHQRRRPARGPLLVRHLTSVGPKPKRAPKSASEPASEMRVRRSSPAFVTEALPHGPG